MEGESDPVKWELSKENIQPLKQGRNANVLSVALDENAMRKLGSVRHEFEEELRTYAGDDPLDVWYRYALWVEQNFPKGGKDSNLKTIIQKCVSSIHGNCDTRDKYKDDGRFLALWVKYANISPNPLEVYSVMESKGLCTGLADYYISWSWELEKMGNFRRADAIYQKGLEVGAVPFDHLQDAHKKFQTRVARATVEGRAMETEPVGADPVRIALTALKVQGKKNRVATERVGSSVLGPAGRVSQTQAETNAGGPAFNIFQDNGSGSSTSVGGTKGGSLPIRNTVNKENVKDPTQWTKAKVNQKTTEVVAVEDIGKYQKPAFAVHADEEASRLGKTPSKLPETSNVLSVRKNFEDWNIPLYVAEPFDPKVQPQYCKHKVYCGMEEFSFEELRAAKVMKLEKQQREKEMAEQEKDAQLQQMQDIMKKQEEMIQQLLQMNNNKNAESQQQDASHGGVPQVTVTSPLEPTSFSPPRKEQKRMEQNSNRSNFHDSWVCMNKSVTASVNASVNASHFLDESSTRTLLQLRPATGTLTPLSTDISEEQEDNAFSSAPNVSGQDTSNNSHSNSRGLNLTDPTVNTKMAMNAINDMWSASLFKDDSIAVDVDANPAPPKQSEQFSIFQDDANTKEEEAVPQMAASEPFAIFCDNATESNQGAKPTSHFPIFQDEPQLTEEAAASTDPNHLYPENQDENAPPEGFKQERNARPLAGVLQPATDIPVCPLEEEMEEEDIDHKPEDVGSAKEGINYDDDLDDMFPLNGTLLADFTLKMPNNPEAFAKNAKVASTPAWFMNKTSGNDNTVGPLTGDNFFSVAEEDEEERKEESSGELMPPPCISHPPSTPPESIAKPALSPIFEASREYKSSSSSSSGYSTTSTTLGSNSVHGLTQCGVFSTTSQPPRSRHSSNTQAEWVTESGTTSQADFTKSGYLADKSRGESLADSRPNNATSQIQTKVEEEELTFDPIQAAKMLMEIDSFPVVSAPAKAKMESSRGSDFAKVSKFKYPKKINPFDEELLGKLLSSLDQKVETRGGFVQMAGKVPLLKPNIQLTLGQEMFHVRRLRGEGAYAKVFQAATLDPLNVTMFPAGNGDDDDEDDDDDEQQMILKIQRPACPWEFYICHELRSRLKAKSYPTSTLDSMMRINRGYFYSNGSILVNEYHKYGTILDVVNGFKLSGQTIPEEIMIFFMVEVMSIVEALHSCNIIHADIKPDNFIVRDIPLVNASGNTPEEIFSHSLCSLKLIDFGRSIDMKLLPEGTTFTEKVATDGFTCCEMREGKPWTYETDWYGVAAIAYCFLFGSYMDVKKGSSGKWELKGASIKRYWKRDLWQSLFSTLLNAPSPSAVQRLKGELMKTFFDSGMHTEISVKLKKLTALLTQRKRV